MDTVVLGLSGGVDSSLAAALLARQGLAVHCVYLDMGLGGGDAAAETARALGLPFEVVDTSRELECHVCAPFAADYLSGRTPIPCAVCNPTVKFPALLRAADRLGARYIATGHYARSGRGENGRTLLLRGKPSNDQSYMLARLTQEILQRVIFPLGDYEKTAVRADAAAERLAVADRPDSMEICFIPDGDYAAWLDKRGGTPPSGNFITPGGAVLGRHKGIHHYTIGQRRGLGISAAGRLFVSAIRPETNEVILSDGGDLHATRVQCSGLNGIAIPGLDGPLEATVRLRHTRGEQAATLTPVGDAVQIDLHEPARAPTPGQMAVFYHGDVVLGSGWIK